MHTTILYQKIDKHVYSVLWQCLLFQTKIQAETQDSLPTQHSLQ